MNATDKSIFNQISMLLKMNEHKLNGDNLRYGTVTFSIREGRVFQILINESIMLDKRGEVIESDKGKQ